MIYKSRLVLPDFFFVLTDMYLTVTDKDNGKTGNFIPLADACSRSNRTGQKGRRQQSCKSSGQTEKDR